MKRMKCELSARPEGRTCGQEDGVRLVRINQMGAIITLAGCATCRAKMLSPTQNNAPRTFLRAWRGCLNGTNQKM